MLKIYLNLTSVACKKLILKIDIKSPFFIYTNLTYKFASL